MTTKPLNIIARIEQYLASYVHFDNPDCAFTAALWAAATHLWPHFDAFPYLVVTSATKQSGKTLFGIDLMSFLCANSVNLGGMTPAVAFRTIDQDKPTLHIDEAETLNNEAATDLRAALNMGYKKGSKFRRAAAGKKGTIEFEVYCPKIFVLIGDVYDTLRDRSIMFRMVRAKPARRFIRAIAESEGNAFRDELAKLAIDVTAPVVDSYHSYPDLDYLSSRDEEIWRPLFAVCTALAPSRIPELQRVAVDLSTEKTGESRSFVTLLSAEKEAMDHQYGERLLRDLATVIGKHRSIFTADAITALKAVPTMPWRKFRGRQDQGGGLTPIDMSNLLSPFGVAPKVIHTNGRRHDAKRARGYRREDILHALSKLD